MEIIISPADGPVIEGLEQLEIVYAKNHPEYKPLRALKSPNGRILTRWHPTAEQRAAIADGADIFLQILTFNKPLQPLLLIVANGFDPLDVVETLEMDIPLISIEPK